MDRHSISLKPVESIARQPVAFTQATCAERLCGAHYTGCLYIGYAGAAALLWLVHNAFTTKFFARTSWRIPNPLLRLTLTSGSLNVYSLINECEM